MDFIENRTFDEINVGDSASLVKTLTYDEIRLFAVMLGDVNPAMVDEAAQSDDIHQTVGRAMWGGSLISHILGRQLPGPGTQFIGQTLQFKHGVSVGDTLTASCTVTTKNDSNRHVVFDCLCVNQHGDVVVAGEVHVTAPDQKIRQAKPEAQMVRKKDPRGSHRGFIERALALPPMPMAVVHPCDRESLLGAVEAARMGLIVPLLIGVEGRIRAVAEQHDIDIGGLQIYNAEHSHAAAELAVDLVRAGKASSIMKGSLHTDELLGAVIHKDKGIRTERRLSHVFVMDVPTYPRPLLITDAAINIEPSLDEKRYIIQNAVDLAHALGTELPKVAILAAVETVNTKMRATLDAAALCKMADRKQITGAILDGPLAFDNAISAEAARTKGIISPVAGQADILMVPDLESGNMLAKQLEYLADAHTAGIVLGAKVPIVLTSRADSAPARITSCAIAVLMANYGPKN